MNAVGASILVVLLLVVLLAPRCSAALGLMAGVMYLTQAQAMNVLGLNLFAVRFLELAGFVRVMARGEFSFSRLNKIDQALILLYGYTTMLYLLRAAEGQAYIVGKAVDALLTYFTFRGLVANMEEWRSYLRSLLVLLAPYAVVVLVEALTHHNVFSLMGGGTYDWVRAGRFRCLGSFRHPDLLGTLGASFLPLYIGLACTGRERILAVAGIGFCLALVWASNSGGPLCASAAGVLCWSLWRVRAEMRKLRWVMIGMIGLLALVMKAPVWYLIARVSSITGGDGWHRAYLVDVSFQHLGSWWLAGIPLSETSEWFPYSLDFGADITNQFLSFGFTAGLGAIALLILLLTRAFSSIGQTLSAVRSISPHPSEGEFLLWGLGAMLTVHIVNWFGISYFDQFYVVWFMQLAAISTLTASPALAAGSTADGLAKTGKECGHIPPADQFGSGVA